MNVSIKNFFAGVLAVAMFFVGGNNVFAGNKDYRVPYHEENLTDLAKDISEQYGVNEKEVFVALQDRRSLDDIHSAALLSKASGKSFKQVLSMKADWDDVIEKLKISQEKIDSTRRELIINDIAENIEVDKEIVTKLLEDNYHPRDIRIAGTLAKYSGKNIYEVLGMRNINNTWFDVEHTLGVMLRPQNNDDEFGKKSPRIKHVRHWDFD